MKNILLSFIILISIFSNAQIPNFEICKKVYADSVFTNGKHMRLDANEKKFYVEAKKQLSLNKNLKATQVENILQSFITYDRIVEMEFISDSLFNAKKYVESSNFTTCIKQSLYLNNMYEKKGFVYAIVKKLPNGESIKIAKEEEEKYDIYYQEFMDFYKEKNDENNFSAISKDIIDDVQMIRSKTIFQDLENAKKEKLASIVPYKKLYSLKQSPINTSISKANSEKTIPKINDLITSVDNLLIRIKEEVSKLDSLKNTANSNWIKLFNNPNFTIEYTALTKSTESVKNKYSNLKTNMLKSKVKYTNDILELSNPIYLVDKELYKNRLAEYNDNVKKFNTIFDDYKKVIEQYDNLEWLYEYKKFFFDGGEKAEYLYLYINQLKTRITNLNSKTIQYNAYLNNKSYQNRKNEINSFLLIHNNHVAKAKQFLSDWEKLNNKRKHIFKNEFNSIKSFNLENCKMIKTDYQNEYYTKWDEIEDFDKKSTYSDELSRFEELINPKSSASIIITNKYSTGVWSYSLTRIENNNYYSDDDEIVAYDSSKEFKVSLYRDGEFITEGNIVINDLGDADEDGSYEYYEILFGNYKNNFSDSSYEEKAIEDIIKQLLRGKFSATKFNF